MVSITYNWLFRFILLCSILITIISVKPYAMSWNDSSRFAMVQALVENNTFVIDDTIFVISDCNKKYNKISPFDPNNPLLNRYGTNDRLYISGHFYSDKSPVPGVIMALTWKILSFFGIPDIRENPYVFIYTLNFLFAGIPFIFSTWCLLRFSIQIGLSAQYSSLLAFTFLFSVVSAYSCSVNTHIQCFACICAALVIVTSQSITTLKSIILGLMVGLGYSTDLGTGPILLVTFSLYVIKWRFLLIFIYGVSALIPIGIHHYLNYQIAGTILPANSIPEYLSWPGSPFNESNMTGGIKSRSFLKFLLYSSDMLFGKKGFLLHIPILLYTSFASFRLIHKRIPETNIIFLSLLFGIFIWLTYSLTSNNLSGTCISIRWFLPIVPFGYLITALSLREFPHHIADIFILGIGQFLLGVEGIYYSCWWGGVLPYYWIIIGITLLTWGILNLWRLVRFINSYRKPMT